MAIQLRMIEVHFISLLYECCRGNHADVVLEIIWGYISIRGQHKKFIAVFCGKDTVFQLLSGYGKLSLQLSSRDLSVELSQVPAWNGLKRTENTLPSSPLQVVSITTILSGPLITCRQSWLSAPAPHIRRIVWLAYQELLYLLHPQLHSNYSIEWYSCDWKWCHKGAVYVTRWKDEEVQWLEHSLVWPWEAVDCSFMQQFLLGVAITARP